MTVEHKVLQLEPHRNGVSGQPFFVGIIEDKEGDQTRTMLVIRFTDVDDVVGAVVCAAFDLDKLAKGEIRFRHNSWRGDVYAATMDDAILKEEG